MPVAALSFDLRSLAVFGGMSSEFASHMASSGKEMQ
jgi:hypothetical protein